jgi:hypothetical protein
VPFGQQEIHDGRITLEGFVLLTIGKSENVYVGSTEGCQQVIEVQGGHRLIADHGYLIPAQMGLQKMRLRYATAANVNRVATLTELHINSLHHLIPSSSNRSAIAFANTFGP